MIMYMNMYMKMIMIMIMSMIMRVGERKNKARSRALEASGGEWLRRAASAVVRVPRLYGLTDLYFSLLVVSLFMNI